MHAYAVPDLLNGARLAFRSLITFVITCRHVLILSLCQTHQAFSCIQRHSQTLYLYYYCTHQSKHRLYTY
jgi:hypothetical protein